MVQREPELAALLEGMDLPEEDAQLTGFLQDLKSDPEKTNKVAKKLQEKYVREEEVAA